MHPYLIRIGNFSLPAYPMLYGIGIALAGLVFLLLSKKEGLNVRKMAHLLLLIAVASVLGGRFFYVLQFSHQFEGNWGKAFNFSEAGQVIYGGLILGLLTIFGYCRKLRLPLGKVFDLIAVSAPIGIAIGRLACFCKGCCYGGVTRLPWGVEYPVHVDVSGRVIGSLAFMDHVDQGLIDSNAAHSLAVHPTQIYSAIVAILIFVMMLYLWKSGKFRGRLLLLFSMVYTACRFCMEFVRTEPKVFSGLTAAQVTGIAVFAACTLIFVIQQKKLSTR